MSTVLTNLRPVNSQSFSDYIGLLAGISRMPGETTAQFVTRVRQFQSNPRSHNYLSSLLDLNALLGLLPKPALTLSGGTRPSLVVNANGVVVTDGNKTVSSSFFSISAGGFWIFRKVSDVAADINASGVVSAVVVNDGLAFRIARQASTQAQLSEPISGSIAELQQPGADPATFTFSNPVPSYTVGATSRLHFVSTVPDGTEISYMFRIWPYTAIAADAVLLSMSDPNISAFCTQPSGALTYQAREIVENLAAVDKSYWSL